MKKDLHPKYYPQAKVVCACGNTFTTGSTMEEITTEVCSKCHPFFTGKQKLLDTARRVDKFQKRVEKAVVESAVRKGKKAKTAKRATTRKRKTDETETVTKTVSKKSAS